MAFSLYKCKFNNSRIEVLSNCTAFFVCVSISGDLRGLSENLNHIFWALDCHSKKNHKVNIILLALPRQL